VPELDHFERIIAPEGELGAVNKILTTGADLQWIGAANGLFRHNTGTNRLTKYVPKEKSLDPRGFAFRAIAVDKTDSNYLWVGGLEGPYRFNVFNGSFEHHPMPFGLHNKDGYLVMDLHNYSDNILWGGSWGGGMLLYEMHSGKWNSYIPEDTKDGRWNGVVFCSLQEDANRIWVAASEGFGMFDISDKEFTFYQWDNRYPGTIDSSFRYTGITKTAQNNVVVTRVNGFSISSTLGNGSARLSHKPALSAILIDRVPLFTDTAVHYIRQIYMAGDDKDATFTLITPGNNISPFVLSYKLEGYDKQWQDLDEGHTVRYTNLPGGHHRFRYRASLDGKEWIEGMPVSIYKSVHFWQTIWFTLLVIVATVSAGVMLYRLNVRNIRRELTMKSEFNKKMAEAELQALRAQMNPHFMFNSLNSIKHYILVNEPLKASEYLTSFATLIRSTLHNSTEKLIPLSKEIETLLLYIELEQLRFKDKFNFQCSIEPGIDTENTMLPPLILQPYVENAIWHGLMHKKDKGTLAINITP